MLIFLTQKSPGQGKSRHKLVAFSQARKVVPSFGGSTYACLPSSYFWLQRSFSFPGLFFLGSVLQAMAGLRYTVYGIRPMIKGHALTTHLNFFIRYSIFYIQQGAFFFFQLCRQAFAQCTSDLSPRLKLSASRINRVDKIGKKNFRVGLLN